MNTRLFDRIGCLVVLTVFVFSGTVALTNWEWFPVKGDWGDIARIPPSWLNYLALLLPPVVLLAYLLLRRLWLKQSF